MLRRMVARWQAEMALKAEARTLARLHLWEDSLPQPPEEGTATPAAEAGAEAAGQVAQEQVLERSSKGKDDVAQGDGSGDGGSGGADHDNDDDDDDDRHGESVIDEAPPRSRGDQPKIDWRFRHGLPGGLHVRICVHRELVPGPELREMVDRLQAEVGKGLLETRRPHGYYLARLDELYGAAVPSEVRWEAE